MALMTAYSAISRTPFGPHGKNLLRFYPVFSPPPIEAARFDFRIPRPDPSDSLESIFHVGPCPFVGGCEPRIGLDDVVAQECVKAPRRRRRLAVMDLPECRSELLIMVQAVECRSERLLGSKPPFQPDIGLHHYDSANHQGKPH